MDAIKWKNDHISVIDAIMLPEQEYYHDYINFREIGAAIEENIIYGYGTRANAIAMALTLTADRNSSLTIDKYKEILTFAVDYFEKITGTSALYRDLFSHLRSIISNGSESTEMIKQFKDESLKRYNQQIDAVKKITANGVSHIKENDTILVFSATGSSIATVGGGLVTSIFNAALNNGTHFEIICAESRPDSSGARIMAWELLKSEHHVTVLPDIQIRQAFQSGKISKVILAADAVHSDGMFVGRSGIGMVAESAKAAGIPVYVICPSYFFDKENTPVTDDKNRASIMQVAFIRNTITVPDGVSILNYNTETFPPENVTALITDRSVIEDVSDNISSIIKT
jgi:methylthioribose-1-phosphate isomerase